MKYHAMALHEKNLNIYKNKDMPFSAYSFFYPIFSIFRTAGVLLDITNEIIFAPLIKEFDIDYAHIKKLIFHKNVDIEVYNL